MEGHDPIILGGGDGSVSSTVDFLAHHHATLGLLPLGTANDFAQTPEIPSELKEACEVIAWVRALESEMRALQHDLAEALVDWSAVYHCWTRP